MCVDYPKERKNRMRTGFDSIGGIPLQNSWNRKFRNRFICVYTQIDGIESIIIKNTGGWRFIEIMRNPAKLMICSKFPPNLTDSRRTLTCQYMQFGQSACMFHISYGLQWRQDRRYIADIGNCGSLAISWKNQKSRIRISNIVSINPSGELRPLW